MGTFELQPTQENIVATLKEDLLKRNDDVFQFVNYLNEIEGSYSIAVDGGWGSGKTFFVKQTKLVLEASNPFFCGVDSDDYESVNQVIDDYKKTSGRSMDLRPQIAVYYDAWANDNEKDPVLSIIYETFKSVGSDFKFKGDTKFLKNAATIAELFTDKKISKLLELAEKEDPFSEIKKEKSLQEQISEFLESLLAENGDRLVIFIDELDRCNPSYAVRLLERVKHYFSNDFITFVFSVNCSELQHTIKRYYGENFNGCRYLDRFFDSRVSLSQANLEGYYQKIGLSNDRHTYEAICKRVIEVNRMDIREIGRYYHQAKIAAYKITHAPGSGTFPGEIALQFSLCCVLPVMLGLKLTDMSKYEEFVQGKNSAPLIEVLGDGTIARGICSGLLAYNETYDTPREGQVLVNLTSRLNEAYDALLMQRYSARGIYNREIGGAEFTQETRNDLMRIASLLSPFSDYSS